MKSKQIIQQVNTVIAKAQYAGLYGVVLESGIGNRICDIEGNEYLDFLSGASTACLGYGRSDVISAYSKTAKRLCHSCFVYSPNVEAVNLAKKLIQITPGDYLKKVMFGLSASDSIDGAIKAARAYTRRKKIVSFRYSYHGSTGLSGQATGFLSLKKDVYNSNEIIYLDFPKTEIDAKKVLKYAETVFRVGHTDIACVIFEPILGDGGNIVPPKIFWSHLLALAQKHQIVSIVDETQTGMGRSGKWWAIEHFKIAPDIIVMGKGLGGGYVAISACVGRAEILDSLSKVQHVFTLSGHPPSCAVASKIISIIGQQHIVSKTERKGKFFKQKLIQVIHRYRNDIHCEVRGMGLHIGISIKSLKNKSLAALFATRCVQKGLYVGYFGPDNEALRLHPPLTITYAELNRAIIVLSEVFKEWKNTSFPPSTYAIYRRYSVGLGNIPSTII
ncbi:hypothetical protein A2Z00_01400 [Candidatus Gottesmanbacteria bacterium RBG_13_45_10]|uniref:Aminotransferase class III n=1 Tax=Candidatus Gottesmanbacteria bacterium RBG_13_45_10 TaxID=1798370 RepID=A0A1F5ZGV0_9BACT|nr:MAG: hypothetical protein A2Z00_01400 [Candidatus Gottesmanbacteria bacterium RBG_13_45_10]